MSFYFYLFLLKIVLCLFFVTFNVKQNRKEERKRKKQVITIFLLFILFIYFSFFKLSYPGLANLLILGTSTFTKSSNSFVFLGNFIFEL